MKRAYWIAFLLIQWAAAGAQIGAGGLLGAGSFGVSPGAAGAGSGATGSVAAGSSLVSSVGLGDILGTSSLPACNPALTTCATTLPVNLLNFEGRRQTPLYVGLDWTTTSEVSNAGFWVERSLGNADAFHRVFFVPTYQNSDLVKHYLATDTNAYAGKTFYRLEQMDLDDQGTWSKTIEVDGYPVTAALKAWPNPGRGVFNLLYPPAANGQGSEVRVYNAFGQLVYDGRTTTVDLSNQACGTYIIEVAGEQVMHTQVVILR